MSDKEILDELVRALGDKLTEDYLGYIINNHELGFKMYMLQYNKKQNNE